MDGIRDRVIAGFRSVPGRGAEVGGVLLGAFCPESREIVIDGFEPVRIEHRFGPSYILSDTDYAACKASPRMVGMYRSHTRPGLRVADEDRALISQLLPDNDGVLLLVKPLSDRECVGAFFPFVKGVVLDGATPSREFPFGAAERPVAIAAPPEPEETPKRRPLSRWVPVTAVVAGIAAAAVLHHISSDPDSADSADENPVQAAAAVSAKPALHLRSEADGSAVRLEWDRDAPAMLGPSDATVSVVDGSKRTSLRLTAKDRKNGYIEWTPRSRESDFEMTVERPGAPAVTESLLVPNPGYAINSFSDTRETKPSPLSRASAPTGDRESAGTGAAAASAEDSGELAVKSQNPGRFKRLVNGVTAKVSHLWPFHSVRQEQPTQ